MNSNSDAVRYQIKRFIKKYEDDGESLMTEDHLNQLLENTEIKHILDLEQVSFDDGVNIGLDIGFRIGMVHLLNVSNSISSQPVDSDEVEINSKDINYI